MYLPPEDLKKVSKMFKLQRCNKLTPYFIAVVFTATLQAESLDEALEGFDDAPTKVVKEHKVKDDVEDDFMEGFDDVTGEKEFKRTDGLIGLEYNGFADTLIAYDADLKTLPLAVDEESYQHAFRVSSDFMNATIKANYLISLFEKSLDEGGLQRAWVKYDIMDGVYANLGVVDYMGSSSRFDAISNNDMAFLDVSYGF